MDIKIIVFLSAITVNLQGHRPVLTLVLLAHSAAGVFLHALVGIGAAFVLVQYDLLPVAVLRFQIIRIRRLLLPH